MDSTPHNTLRWRLIRDALVFQLKLMADATRDLLLSPLSIIAVVVDLLSHPSSNEQSYFYRLLRMGRSSERWINLFAAATPRRRPTDASMDFWLQQMEQVLVKEYERGGITANAKNAVDESLDRWREQINPNGTQAPGASAQNDNQQGASQQNSDQQGSGRQTAKQETQPEAVASQQAEPTPSASDEGDTEQSEKSDVSKT